MTILSLKNLSLTLNGKKILVLGNHDKVNNDVQRLCVSKIKEAFLQKQLQEENNAGF